MTHEEHHRALVKRLAGALTPARRLWPIGVRLALWLAIQTVVVAWVVFHARADFLSRLAVPRYGMELGVFSAAAIVSAWLALKTAIPGRSVRRAEVVLVIALVGIGTALLMVGQRPDLDWRLGEFFRVGVSCAYATCILAVLPWLGLWWAVNRGAPMRGGVSGMWVGSGALFFAFALMHIACPIDDPSHLIAWHFLPAVALIAVSALAGNVWLGFRVRLLRREPAA